MKECKTEIDTLTNQKVYSIFEKGPEFPGGNIALFKEASKKMRFPTSVRSEGAFKIIVAFVVKDDGVVVGQRTIANVKGTDLAEQFLDVIDDFKWAPGTCDGKAISSLVIVPWSVKLGN